MTGNKYHAQKVTRGSLTFDSKAEERRYWQLKSDPTVQSIEVHPTFLLQNSFKKCGFCGKIYKIDLKNCPICSKRLDFFRSIEYTADFKVVYLDGKVEIEDVKGVETRDFLMRKKMFELVFPQFSLKVVKAKKPSRRRTTWVKL